MFCLTRPSNSELLGKCLEGLQVSSYQQKFYNVLKFIDSNLDDELNVDALSQVAHLSKYHFHRQFSALYGITVSAYIKQLRMKRATFQLAFRSEDKVIDIALSNGYGSSEAFSKAYKKTVGQSPSNFRKEPAWNPWHETHKSLFKLRNKLMNENETTYEINIVDFKETLLAVLEHRGAPEKLGYTISQFISWRKENKFLPRASRTFNLIYDDPAVMTPGKYRFDVCASVKNPIQNNNYGVVNKVIPTGRCAVVRHIGSDDTIGYVVNYLYSDWLKQSGEELRDFPLFFERVSFFPDVSENEMITDIYLPLR